jgi:hypothetical protein
VTAPVRKRDQVADMLRARIATGSLKPGAPVPSGPELAKETGFAVRTCQAAVLALLGEGALTRVSPTARPRVAGGGQEPEMQLAQSLAERRHLAGLTQQELADKLGVHVTTVCHAETAVAGPPVLGEGGPGAGRQRRPNGPVRHLAGGPGIGSRRCPAGPVRRPAGGQRGGGRARHAGSRLSGGSPCSARRAGRDRHHASLRPDAGYGQVG